MQLKIILEVEQDSICARCHYSTYIELFSLYPSDGNYSTVLLEEARVSSLTLVINCLYYQFISQLGTHTLNLSKLKSDTWPLPRMVAHRRVILKMGFLKGDLCKYWSLAETVFDQVSQRTMFSLK